MASIAFPTLAKKHVLSTSHTYGYAYSPALKASGLTWDRQTLDAWLTSPQKKVPGTKMPFAGSTGAEGML